MEPTPRYAANGGQLRKVRVVRGLSLRELSRRSGVSPSTICAIEAGRSGGTPRVIRALADGLSMPIEELLTTVYERASA